MRPGIACLVVLAVAAGCSGLAVDGPEEATPTVTPAPVPSSTPTPTPTVGQVAPGVETTGVVDLNALVVSHYRVTRNASWVWSESSTVVRTFDNGTYTTTRNQTVTFRDRETYRREADLLISWTRRQVRFFPEYEAYADGDVVHEKWYSPERERVVYDRDYSPRVGRSFPGFALGPLRDYVPLAATTVSRVDVGDRPHYAVVGTRSSVPQYGEAATYSARAVVREDGFVRSLNVSYAVERPGGTIEGGYAFSYRQVGDASVDPPDWLDEANTQSAPRNGSTGH